MNVLKFENTWFSYSKRCVNTLPSSLIREFCNLKSEKNEAIRLRSQSYSLDSISSLGYNRVNRNGFPHLFFVSNNRLHISYIYSRLSIAKGNQFSCIDSYRHSSLFCWIKYCSFDYNCFANEWGLPCHRCKQSNFAYTYCIYD